MTEERTKMNECYSCKNRRDVFYSAHTECVKPDAEMVGNKHGIKNGWFMYPINFDPVWKEKLCDNYESKTVVSEPISVASESK